MKFTRCGKFKVLWINVCVDWGSVSKDKHDEEYSQEKHVCKEKKMNDDIYFMSLVKLE